MKNSNFCEKQYFDGFDTFFFSFYLFSVSSKLTACKEIHHNYGATVAQWDDWGMQL